MRNNLISLSYEKKDIAFRVLIVFIVDFLFLSKYYYNNLKK